MKYIFIILVFCLFSCRREIPEPIITIQSEKSTSEINEIIETFPNGNVKTEYIYFESKNDSNYTIKMYYENGQTEFKGIVRNGKFVGEKLNYHDNGVLREVDSILNPCDLDFCCCDGKVIRYFRNGELDQTFENRNGVANGLVSIFDRDSTGRLLKTSEYKNSRKNGIEKIFFKNGKVHSIQEFKNDTAINFIYYFKENGDTLKYINHFKGKKDFPAKKWLKNGQIFYANYIDSNYKEVLFRWSDRNGNEIKREIIKIEIGKDYELPD
jgi:antitoxin component YwqK of YwqJK toxin-antitoxin module